MPSTTMFSPAAAISIPRAESGAILARIGDDVVGGKQPEHRIRIVAKQEKCRQADGGRGVASDGFGDDLLRTEASAAAAGWRGAGRRW